MDPEKEWRLIMRRKQKMGFIKLVVESIVAVSACYVLVQLARFIAN